MHNVVLFISGALFGGVAGAIMTLISLANGASHD